ncbi:MAG TPA: hypothetical protein VN837_04045, partial [Chloroflexota bacterium]|nr:hypothetical protein [Chloroflexota bacterium]
MIAEYVDSRSEVMGGQEPSLPPRVAGDGWSADDLLDAVDRLCLAYSLPLLGRDQGPVMAEARAFETMGMASSAYLACAVACAIRVTSSGPAVAFGRWGGSVILSHLLATIPAAPDEPELFLDLAPGPTDLSPDWSRQPPLFLVAEEPHANILRVLGDDPLLSDARITDSPGSFALRATVGALPRPTGHVHEDSPAGARDRTVELRPSRLLWLLREAMVMVEQETGAMARLGEENVAWPISGSLPHAELLAGLPEIPAWAATARAYGPTSHDSASLWLALAPSLPTLSAAAALRTRAYLAHALVALASGWPALDWTALLATVPKPGDGTHPVAALPVDLASGEESASGEVTARGVPEALTLKQGGTTPWQESGSVVGDRPWRHNDEMLTVLALNLGQSPAHAIVKEFPAHRSDGEDIPALVVTRPAESPAPVWVEAALVA